MSAAARVPGVHANTLDNTITEYGTGEQGVHKKWAMACIIFGQDALEFTSCGAHGFVGAVETALPPLR